MSLRRLRMFAGPNGSGKTTLLRKLRAERFLPLGYNLNPDDIDLAVANGEFRFSHWGLRVTDAELQAFCLAHPLGSRVDVDQVHVDGDALVLYRPHRPGYLAAVLSDLLRRRWVTLGRSFTYETVMSSEDKVTLLDEAYRRGFRTYTYFVCTDRPEINVDRVAMRVASGGHHVSTSKIIDRHARSLALLPRAVALSSRAYLFDNSDKPFQLVAEYDEGRLVGAAAEVDLPWWFTHTMSRRAR